MGASYVEEHLQDIASKDGVLGETEQHVENREYEFGDTVVTDVRGISDLATEFIERFGLQRSMQELFQAIDADGNQSLSSDEVNHFLYKAVSYDTEKSKKVFFLLDADGNGVLDLDESATLLFLLTRRNCATCWRIVTDRDFLCCQTCENRQNGKSFDVCRSCYENSFARGHHEWADEHCGHTFEWVANATDYFSQYHPAVVLRQLINLVLRHPSPSQRNLSLSSTVPSPATSFARVSPAPSQASSTSNPATTFAKVVQCVSCKDAHDVVSGYLLDSGHVHHLGNGRYVCEFCGKKRCVRCGVVRWSTKEWTCRPGRWKQHHKCTTKCQPPEGRSSFCFPKEETYRKSCDPNIAQCTTCCSKLKNKLQGGKWKGGDVIGVDRPGASSIIAPTPQSSFGQHSHHMLSVAPSTQPSTQHSNHMLSVAPSTQPSTQPSLEQLTVNAVHHSQNSQPSYGQHTRSISAPHQQAHRAPSVASQTNPPVTRSTTGTARSGWGGEPEGWGFADVAKRVKNGEEVAAKDLCVIM